MQNANLIGQILGETATKAGAQAGAQAKKGKGAADNSLAALLGGTDDKFKSLLLGGLAKARRGHAAADVLGASASPAKKSSSADIDPSALLGTAAITPELLTALKSVTTADLGKLPPQLAQVLSAHMNADGTLDAKVQGLLDTLAASLSKGGVKSSDLFKIINDPKLASFLAGLGNALHALSVPADTQAVPVAEVSAKTFSSFLPSVAANAKVVSAVGITPAGNALQITTDQGTITISVDQMNVDQFNAFKKLAFADIAPFLTMPRTVRVDGNTVMKVAQGPAFLNDGTTQNTLLATVTGMASTTTPAGAFAGTDTAAAAPDAPLFLDSALVARATAQAQGQPVPQTDALGQVQAQVQTQADIQVQAQAQTQTPAAAVPGHAQVFNRAHLFAALLGLPTQPQGQPAAAQAQTQTHTAGTSAGNSVPVAASQPQVVTPSASAAQVTAAAQTPIIVTITSSPLRGTGATALKGLDTSAVKVDGDESLASFASSLSVHADTTAPAGAASTLLAARSAAQPHPASYMVSVALHRGADGAVPGQDKQFTIQLDPPELGRVKITLQFGEDNSVKAKLTAERPETMALLQKDSHALERSLHNAGFDVNADSLSFDLGQNGSFEGAMSQNGNSNQYSQEKSSSDDSGTEFATLETVMPIFVDPVTGLTHVNIVI